MSERRCRLGTGHGGEVGIRGARRAHIPHTGAGAVAHASQRSQPTPASAAWFRHRSRGGRARGRSTYRGLGTPGAYATRSLELGVCAGTGEWHAVGSRARAPRLRPFHRRDRHAHSHPQRSAHGITRRRTVAPGARDDRRGNGCRPALRNTARLSPPGYPSALPLWPSNSSCTRCDLRKVASLHAL